MRQTGKSKNTGSAGMDEAILAIVYAAESEQKQKPKGGDAGEDEGGGEK